MKFWPSLFLAGVALAQSGDDIKPETPASTASRASPAFQQVVDVPNRPRVLLIGDSISIGYTTAVRTALADRANVHRAPVNCGPSSKGVEELDAWLGSGRWDVIHFNFGLHDIRLLDGGARLVPPEQYEANLRRILERLQRTGARLIWATTTPVQAKNKPGQYPRRQEDVALYNKIATAIMQEGGVAINDLHASVRDRLNELQKPADVHFNEAGYAVLARQVNSAISDALAVSK